MLFHKAPDQSILNLEKYNAGGLIQSIFCVESSWSS